VFSGEVAFPTNAIHTTDHYNIGFLRIFQKIFHLTKWLCLHKDAEKNPEIKPYKNAIKLFAR